MSVRHQPIGTYLKHVISESDNSNFLKGCLLIIAALIVLKSLKIRFFSITVFQLEKLKI